MGKWRWKVGVGESAVDGISITGGRQLVLACLVPPDVEPPMVLYRTDAVSALTRGGSSRAALRISGRSRVCRPLQRGARCQRGRAASRGRQRRPAGRRRGEASSHGPRAESTLGPTLGGGSWMEWAVHAGLAAVSTFPAVDAPCQSALLVRLAASLSRRPSRRDRRSPVAKLATTGRPLPLAAATASLCSNHS